jgi:hypothetical protein
MALTDLGGALADFDMALADFDMALADFDMALTDFDRALTDFDRALTDSDTIVSLQQAHRRRLSALSRRAGVTGGCYLSYVSRQHTRTPRLLYPTCPCVSGIISSYARGGTQARSPARARWSHGFRNKPASQARPLLRSQLRDTSVSNSQAKRQVSMDVASTGLQGRGSDRPFHDNTMPLREHGEADPLRPLPFMRPPACIISTASHVSTVINIHFHSHFYRLSRRTAMSSTSVIHSSITEGDTRNQGDLHCSSSLHPDVTGSKAAARGPPDWGITTRVN